MFVEKQRVAEWFECFSVGKPKLWQCFPVRAAGKPSGKPIMSSFGLLGGGTLDIALNTGREEESGTYWLALPRH